MEGYVHAISLEEIMNRHNYVLIDTSAFNDPLDQPYNKLSTLEDKLSNMDMRISFINHLIGLVDSPDYKHNLFLTKTVVDEILQKSKRSNSGALDWTFKHGNKRFYYEAEKIKRKRKSIVRMLANKEGVLDLSITEPKLFNHFIHKYNYLRQMSFNTKSCNGFSIKGKLSETDFDLIGTVWIISMWENKIALVSNDFPIMRSLSRIIKNDSLRRDRVSLFVREEYDKYAIFGSLHKH